MRTTCVKHPEDQPLIQIKAWQVYATGGNHCAAALLSFFEYWHNIKTQEIRKREEEGKKVYDEAYQYQTDENLREGLLGLYNTATIRESLTLLESLGFLTITKNPNAGYGFDRKKFFIFHPKKVNEYLEKDYPQNAYKEFNKEHFLNEFVYSEKEKEKKKAKNKNDDAVSKNDDASDKNTNSSGKNDGAITEITSEITTEISSSLTPSQSSEDFSEESSILDSSGISESTESIQRKPEDTEIAGSRLIGEYLTTAISDGQSSGTPLVPAKTRNKKSKRDLVNEKANDPSFIAFFQKMRSSFTFFSGNKFLRDFGNHRVQFYKTLAYRVANGEVMSPDIEKAFSLMENHADFSIMQFLENLKSKTYPEKKILLDFIWIMTDGKVAAPIAEKKGAKELSEWVEDDKTNLTEIEDCFYWMPTSGRSYGVSLLSVKSALKEFDKVKTLSQGRYVGKSLNSYKTQNEKTVEILQNRNYDEMAKNAIALGEAKRKQWDEIVKQADGE